MATRFSVLIVEDNVITTRIIQSLVTRYFKPDKTTLLHIDTASSATKALYLIEEQLYNIIFFDNHLQKGEVLGSEVARRTRMMHRPQAIMISMTAYERVSAKEGLFDAYLEKPIDFDTLRVLLDKLLKR